MVSSAQAATGSVSAPAQNLHFITQKQKSCQIQIDKLFREKCEYVSNLNYFKQKIQEIEMRQNEAIRDVSSSILQSSYYRNLFIS